MANKIAIPPNWQNSLEHSDNKIELFQFLADEVVQISAQNLWSQRLSSVHIKLVFRGRASTLTKTLTATFLCMSYRLYGIKAIMIKANDMDAGSFHLVTSPLFRVWGWSSCRWHVDKVRAWIRYAWPVSLYRPGESQKHFVLPCLYTLCHLSTPWTRKWSGLHGTFIQRHLRSFVNWVRTRSQRKMATWRYRRIVSYKCFDKSSTVATLDEARLDIFVSAVLGA